ncbi:MAG: hypothetical protein ACYC91_08520 [Solirubrobacteraceae bacterium]
MLLSINWIWTGDAIQVGQFGFAILVVWGSALLLWLLARDAVRRGPPAQRSDPEVLPAASLAAVTTGLSVACILFGVVWAQFFVLFGAGILIASLSRLALELRAERASRRRIGREDRA